ncbi:MFS transporter [Singulisphaera acidiphila]|uniref:Arabinose efflux permease family protein n=1 Tax=Singulisphaera acidiphila (strain ATCC BAA-1392 / DSM 18658 / VKM B-2454 / MOB10) TaxID=886293 RepID=L0DAT5_SINAD|nr:MFS transporter [Singulisphaera acidiphila]AGA25960.1 arabinose efflux permease family protein [Singulisphaera acidiphila DSM 18658]
MANAFASDRIPTRSRTFAALANPDYRRFYLGQGISLIGTWLQGAAINWIVFEKTRSESMLGVVGAAALFPGLVVGLIAGVIADRVVPRRMILIMEVAQMVLAFAVTFLIGFGIVQVWHLIVILMLTRVCVTFEMPSRQVFLYDVVGRADLSNAIALNSGLFNASRVIGPALAGVVYAGLGATACFALNGASYLAAIVAVLMIRLPSRRSPPGAKGGAEILGGFAYIGSDRKVMILFVLMTFFGVVGMGYDSMIPAYATRVVGTDVRGYSVLLASSGVGATIGAFWMASFSTIERKERLVLAGLLIFAVSLAASAMLPPLAGLAALPNARLVTATLCLFGIGFGAVLFYAATQTMIQNTLPDHLRGRVMAIWIIAYSGSVPLGSLWTGYVASRYGVTFAMTVSSCICAVVGLLGGAAWLLVKPPANRLHLPHNESR